MKNNPRLEDFLISLDTQFDNFIINYDFLNIQKNYISMLNIEDLILFYDKDFFPMILKKLSIYLNHKGFYNKENLIKKGLIINNELLKNEKYENEIYKEILNFLVDMSNIYKDKKNIYAKYLFYLKNHKQEELSEEMTKIENKISNFIKNCYPNVNKDIEKINESAFYETIIKLLTSSQRIISNKLIGLNDSFISLYSKDTEPSYYIDSLCFIEGDESCDSFNFCGHATTDSLSEQGSLFFENPPEFKMQKMFLLKSYTDFNKEEQNLFNKKTDFSKLKIFSNNSKFYYILYNIVKNKKDIGNKFLNTNLIYSMNTLLVFLGDGFGLDNNFNQEMFKLLYSEESEEFTFNSAARFHYVPIKINSKAEEKIFYKILNDLNYILDNILTDELSKNIYTISNKIKQLMEETVKTYDILHKLFYKKIDSKHLKIINKLKSILGIETLNINIQKSKVNCNFQNLLTINKRKNFLNFNEKEIKSKIITFIAKIINTNKILYIDDNLINVLMNETFTVNNQNELLSLITKYSNNLSNIKYYNICPIIKNFANLENFINYIFFDFYYNIKNKIYKEKNTNTLFLIFILIFNIKHFENEFLKPKNTIIDYQTYFNFKEIINGNNEYLKLIWILNALIYPNNNFNHFEEKNELITYLYFELFNSHFEVEENKKNIEHYVDNLITEYNKRSFSENDFLFSFLNYIVKNDIKYYPVLLMSLYHKTSCNLLKASIMKFICGRNHNFLFTCKNNHIWKESESLIKNY